MANWAKVVLTSVERGLRFTGHAQDGTTTAMESAKEKGAPSPVELLLMALGGCSGMDVIDILRKKRQQVSSYEVIVSGERRDEHPRIFTRIEVVHTLRGRNLSPTAVEEAIRLTDTKYCTVHGMLERASTLTSRYEIVDE